MGVTLFALFTAMEIGLAVLSCTKLRGTLASHRNTLICCGVEFIIMLIVFLMPIGDARFRFLGCLAVFGMRLMFAAMGFVIKLIKHKGMGAEETMTSRTGAIIGCAANLVLIFCFIFPATVFPGFTEQRVKDGSIAVMTEILEESNENASPEDARINSALFELIIFS